MPIAPSGWPPGCRTSANLAARRRHSQLAQMHLAAGVHRDYRIEVLEVVRLEVARAWRRNVVVAALCVRFVARVVRVVRCARCSGPTTGSFVVARPFVIEVERAPEETIRVEASLRRCRAIARKDSVQVVVVAPF